MKFVVRDDDLNYFDGPAEIERWYGPVFSIGIPVGFSAVPFVNPGSDVCMAQGAKDVLKQDREYSIGENSALAEYVKQHPLIEIMQHGRTHETKGGVFEYRRTRGLFEETRRGKEELEKTFERKITVFVPPHDAISNHGIRAIEAAGMDIIRGVGMKNFLPRPHYFAAGLKMAFHRLRFPVKSRMPAYPYVIDFGGHKEAFSYRIEMGENLLQKGLEYAYRKNGNFIITNHLYVFDETKKQLLLALLRRAQELGAKFVRPSELF